MKPVTDSMRSRLRDGVAELGIIDFEEIPIVFEVVQLGRDEGTDLCLRALGHVDPLLQLRIKRHKATLQSLPVEIALGGIVKIKGAFRYTCSVRNLID